MSGIAPGISSLEADGVSAAWFPSFSSSSSASTRVITSSVLCGRLLMRSFMSQKISSRVALDVSAGKSNAALPSSIIACDVAGVRPLRSLYSVPPTA